jgi:hypothetical protein
MVIVSGVAPTVSPIVVLKYVNARPVLSWLLLIPNSGVPGYVLCADALKTQRLRANIRIFENFILFIFKDLD